MLMPAAAKVDRSLKCIKCTFLGTDEDGFNFRAGIETFTNPEELAENISRYIDIISSAGQRTLRMLKGG